jgi:class 3 adenylate cyclase
VEPAARGLAHVVVRPGAPDEREIVVQDRLYVGRECAGIDDDHRLLVEGPDISRDHLEIRLDPALQSAYVIDSSTNGTRLNGVRIERAVRVPLKSGDRLKLGDVELQFHSDLFRVTGELDSRRTSRRITTADLVMAVGDVVDYSAMAETNADEVIAADMETLYSELRRLLRRHQGTLSDLVGDAFFAVWELEHIEGAGRLAVDFALAAGAAVERIAPTLGVTTPSGAPLRMGWGIVRGEAAVSTLTGSVVSIVGDDTNVAFRLSGVAGRGGEQQVLITSAVAEQLGDGYETEGPREVTVKGRTNPVTVYGVKK